MMKSSRWSLSLMPAGALALSLSIGMYASAYAAQAGKKGPAGVKQPPAGKQRAAAEETCHPMTHPRLPLRRGQKPSTTASPASCR